MTPGPLEQARPLERLVGELRGALELAARLFDRGERAGPLAGAREVARAHSP